MEGLGRDFSHPQVPGGPSSPRRSAEIESRLQMRETAGLLTFVRKRKGLERRQRH